MRHALQLHAKALRSSLSGSDGSGTNGAKNCSEATGADLAYLGGRAEDSPSRDSVSLQQNVCLVFLALCLNVLWQSCHWQ